MKLKKMGIQRNGIQEFQFNISIRQRQLQREYTFISEIIFTVRHSTAALKSRPIYRAEYSHCGLKGWIVSEFIKTTSLRVSSPNSSNVLNLSYVKLHALQVSFLKFCYDDR